MISDETVDHLQKTIAAARLAHPAFCRILSEYIIDPQKVENRLTAQSVANSAVPAISTGVESLMLQILEQEGPHSADSLREEVSRRKGKPLKKSTLYVYISKIKEALALGEELKALEKDDFGRYMILTGDQARVAQERVRARSKTDVELMTSQKKVSLKRDVEHVFHAYQIQTSDFEIVGASKKHPESIELNLVHVPRSPHLDDWVSVRLRSGIEEGKYGPFFSDEILRKKFHPSRVEKVITRAGELFYVAVDHGDQP